MWTFDPLVRRNAWFNIAVLGAEVAEYLPSFYGSMTDAINAGDESDRLLVAWDVGRPVPDHATRRLTTSRDSRTRGRRLTTSSRSGGPTRRRWHSGVPAPVPHSPTALAAGRPIVGFTRAGEYVIGSAP